MFIARCTLIKRSPASRSSVIVDLVYVIVLRKAEKLLSASTLVHGKVPPIRNNDFMLGNMSSFNQARYVVFPCAALSRPKVAPLSQLYLERTWSQEVYFPEQHIISQFFQVTAGGKSWSRARPTRSLFGKRLPISRITWSRNKTATLRQ